MDDGQAEYLSAMKIGALRSFGCIDFALATCDPKKPRVRDV